jgi:hypothetical protein
MGSVSHSVDATRRSEFSIQNDTKIAKAAGLLIARHGEDAGAMAARRADALFNEGNRSEGARWVAIFRKIAMTPPCVAP